MSKPTPNLELITEPTTGEAWWTWPGNGPAGLCNEFVIRAAHGKTLCLAHDCPENGDLTRIAHWRVRYAPDPASSGHGISAIQLAQDHTTWVTCVERGAQSAPVALTMPVVPWPAMVGPPHLRVCLARHTLLVGSAVAWLRQIPCLFGPEIGGCRFPLHHWFEYRLASTRGDSLSFDHVPERSRPRRAKPPGRVIAIRGVDRLNTTIPGVIAVRKLDMDRLTRALAPGHSTLTFCP